MCLQDFHGVLVGAEPPQCLGFINGERLDEDTRARLTVLWGSMFAKVAPPQRVFKNLDECIQIAQEQKFITNSGGGSSKLVIDWRNILLLQRKQFLRDVFRADLEENHYLILPLPGEVDQYLLKTFVSIPSIAPWFTSENIAAAANGKEICESAG